MSPNIPVETSLFVKCHVDDDDVHVTLTLFSDFRSAAWQPSCQANLWTKYEIQIFLFIKIINKAWVWGSQMNGQTSKNSGFKLYILHFYKFSGALKKPVSFYVISYD